MDEYIFRQDHTHVFYLNLLIVTNLNFLKTQKYNHI